MNNMDILKTILPSRLYEVAERTGISSTKQIIILSFWDIKKKTNLKDNDIIMLKKIITQYCCPVSLPGNKLQKQIGKLKTGFAALDNILKGGFRRSTVTEIYGESGTGKTQVVMQVAAHCGTDGSVFICTEDLFPVKRFNQICQNICPKNTDFGKNIFIEHLTESHQLSTCVRMRLPKLLDANKISVVIVDSVAAPFRCEYTNYIQRAEDLKELGILLYQLAQDYNIAIICVNQVTSYFDHSDNVLPSLGLAWSNLMCYKLKINKTTDTHFIKSLDQDVTVREVKVMNAPELPVAVAKFVITANGIENVK